MHEEIAKQVLKRHREKDRTTYRRKETRWRACHVQDKKETKEMKEGERKNKIQKKERVRELES